MRNPTTFMTHMHSFKSHRGAVRPAIIGGCCLIALILGATLYMGFSGRGHPDFPLEAYYDSPRAFAGNQYSLECRIDSQTDYDEGIGRMLVVRSLSGNFPLVVFSPESLSGFAPHSGQVYRLDLRIDGHGVAVIQSFRKL